MLKQRDVKGVGKLEMATGEQPVIGISDVFAKPGTYTLQVRPSFIICSLLAHLQPGKHTPAHCFQAHEWASSPNPRYM